nr:CIH_HP1_G0043690.mRNA.1.CDS.1 [Saccharomyces cerevisiae]
MPSKILQYLPGLPTDKKQRKKDSLGAVLQFNGPEPPIKRLKKASLKGRGEVIDYNDDESLAKADRTVIFANVFNIYKSYTK